MKYKTSRSMRRSGSRSSMWSFCSSCDACSARGAGGRRQSPPCRYKKIKAGLQRANPAAIVLWTFHKLSSKGAKDGLTSRRIINFIKEHYVVGSDPRRTGKSIGALLRSAIDFGLLIKRGNRYYLAI